MEAQLFDNLGFLSVVDAAVLQGVAASVASIASAASTKPFRINQLNISSQLFQDSVFIMTVPLVSENRNVGFGLIPGLRLVVGTKQHD